MNGEINYTITRWKGKDGSFLTEHEYDNAIANGGNEEDYEETDIELTVGYSGECVDNGIGDYEYWGFKGVDHDYAFEVEVESVKDEDDEDWMERLTEDEMSEIVEECEEDGKDYDGGYDDEPPEPDYDYDDRW